MDTFLDVTPHARTIEMYAINHLEFCIGNEQLLESKIPRGDTDPSWDGEIHIYSEPKHNAVQQGVKRVPVQVKGKFMPENIKKQRITYPVRYGDLRNYANERGCVYFVIAVSNEESGYAIFYNILTPLKVNTFLKGAEDKTGDKTVSLAMNKLNHKKRGDLLRVLYQYDLDWRKQISIKPVQINEGKSYEINCTAVGVSSTQELFQKFNAGDLCLYLKEDDGREIPIEWDSTAKMFELGKINKPVVVDGQIYYKEYNVLKNEEDVCYIVLSPNISFDLKTNVLHFQINSGLKALKDDALFLRKIYDGNALIEFTGYKKCRFAYKITRDICEQLDLIDSLYAMFNHVGAELNIPYTKLDREEAKQLDFLLNAYNRRIDKEFLNNTMAYRFFINNTYLILFIVINQETNELEFINAFRKSGYVHYVYMDDGTRYRAPMFVLSDIGSEIYSKLYDYNYEYIVEAISEMEFDEKNFVVINDVLLRVINAYELSNGRQIILDTAEKIAKMILEKYPGNNVAMVNYLQIIKRKRNLTRDEKESLEKIKKESEDVLLICGINILLENNYDILKEYTKMTDEQKAAFMGYPIVKLYNGKWE